MNTRFIHNLSVESAHDKGIYTTPDITIIVKDGVSYDNEVYESKIRFSYASQSNLVSFCEVKQFNPFPELLFNFVGVVNELLPEILSNTAETIISNHIAPCLMISGTPNKHTTAIKKSLERRYCINIIYSMFYTATITFSKKNVLDLRTKGVLTPDDTKEKMDPFDEMLDVFIGSD